MNHILATILVRSLSLSLSVSPEAFLSIDLNYDPEGILCENLVASDSSGKWKEERGGERGETSPPAYSARGAAAERFSKIIISSLSDAVRLFRKLDFLAKIFHIYAISSFGAPF